jgi:DNA-binding beta-propeller fold protein YncE
MKEGCKAVAKKECKSAEVAEKLDTKTEYGLGGSQIAKVTGPEHTIKLSSGAEEKARAVTHHYYDEGSSEAEEANHETYSLVTKSTSGALLSNGEEQDVRTTVSSYSGQKGLGWKLRKPTSVTVDPRGLDLTTSTVYNETTGSVIESKAPAGTSELVSPPVFSTWFGSEGSGAGEFKHPVASAVDASGNVWVLDQGNDRVEKFSSAGGFLAAYGSEGTGEKQFRKPWGIAINQSTGDIYISDTENNRVEELSSSGGYITSFGSLGSGNGQLDRPLGLTIDAKGDVWVADAGNSRVEEFSSSGAYLSQIGKKGSGAGELEEPSGIAISGGELYVSDYNLGRVEEFSPSGEYLAQISSKGSGEGQLGEPMGIAANPTSGDLYVSNISNVLEFSPSGKYLATFGEWGAGKGQFNEAIGLTVNATGELYVADEKNDRVDEWLPPEAGGAHLVYSTQFGSYGWGEGQFDYSVAPAVDGHGDVWVADGGGSRIEKFTPQGTFLASYGSYGTGNGQFGQPHGLAINQSTGDVYVSDCEEDRIEELSSTGEFVRSFGSEGSEHGQLKCPGGLAIDSSGDVWVADTGNDRIQRGIRLAVRL